MKSIDMLRLNRGRIKATVIQSQVVEPESLR